MLRVVEAILEDELARLATMPTSSRCLSNRNMNNNRCVGLHVSNLSTVVKEDMVWAVVVQHLGRGCMMMFRNQPFQPEEVVVVEEEEEEEAEEDIRADGEVEVRGDLPRLKVDLKVHRPLMPQLDRRMLVSQERTIVVVVGAAIEASTLMLVVESRNDAFFTSIFCITFGQLVWGFEKYVVDGAYSCGIFLHFVTIQNIA
jgi:hypothetical protein